MKQEDIKCYIGKKTQIFLNNKLVFNGDIIEINEDSIKIIDKFGSVVSIALSEILIIKTIGDKIGRWGFWGSN